MTHQSRDTALPVRRGRRRAASAGLRRGWWALAVRLAVAGLSFVIFVGSGYAWATYRSFTSNVTHVDAIVPHVDPAPGATPIPRIDGTDENILLVGDDHRPANASPALLQELSTQDDGGGVNTDTMLILHVPADGSKATLISFPRDSWVSIPGFGMNKLNAAFELGSENGGGDTGGSRLLIRVLQNMTGLTIDHFVRVSMIGFYEIAQVLGPIQVCLKHAAVDPYSGTNLPAGVSTLDAKQALSFVRQRHNLPDGDLDREIRQQYFLSQEFSRIASAGTLLNPFKMQKLLSAVSSNLETDPGLNLVTFAQQMENLKAGNLTAATIPISGTPTIYVNGSAVSIVQVNTAAMPAFINAVIGKPTPPTAYQQAGTVSPTTVTVTVINGTGETGLATSQSTKLREFGFRTGTPGSTATTATTTLEYPAGMEAQAKTLAAYIPGATVTATTTVTTLTLVLGTDDQRVQAASAHPAATPAPATSSPTHSYTASTTCID